MGNTILVTGACGGVGSWIVDELRSEYNIVAVDLELPESTDIENVNFRRIDLTDQGQVYETVLDIEPDTVVHLGNLPHEQYDTGGRVFENNAISTFHILTMAGRVDADVVWASSETVYGTHWPAPELPEYLPIDEKHPVRPWNGYETSKIAGEAAAMRVTNTYNISVTTIRPSWIQYPGNYQVTSIREAFELDSATSKGNLWSYIDIRDVVSIFVAGIKANVGGHEIYNAFGPDNYLGIETETIIEAGYGDLPDECSLMGDESAFSTRKAEEMLDWEPKYSWKTVEDELVSGPDFV